MEFEKVLVAVKDQIQYRSQSLLNLARGYFSFTSPMNLYQSQTSKIEMKVICTSELVCLESY